MKGSRLILMACLLVPFHAFAAPASKVETGNISDSSKNSGSVISIGGGKMESKSLIGSDVSGKIGNIEETETNVGSVVIEDNGAEIKTGNISDSSKNSGSVINLGSEVNEGTIKIKGGH